MASADSGSEDAFTVVFRPRDQGELALVKELLERLEVAYHVQNEFGVAGALPLDTGAGMAVLVETGKAMLCDQLLRRRFRGEGAPLDD